MVVNLVSARLSDGSGGVFGNVRGLADVCKHCVPITPVQCISLCRFYRVKNELRNLRNVMNNPCYVVDFFNVLKNQTRLHIFHIIVNRRCTLSRIQQELGRVDIKQSQGSISEEHIQSLITVGLISESLGKYSATLFGTCVYELLDGFAGFLRKLPSQSKCHEETLLQALLLGPKTYEEIKCLFSPVVAPRIIKRLIDAELVSIPVNRSYVFFHKSKRNLALEKLTASEMIVYQAISSEGVDIGNLTKLVGLSQRRIYAHIRRLKGKKLVFAKNVPLIYSLTDAGQKLATILYNLMRQIVETWNFTQYLTSQADGSYLSDSRYVCRG